MLILRYVIVHDTVPLFTPFVFVLLPPLQASSLCGKNNISRGLEILASLLTSPG